MSAIWNFIKSVFSGAWTLGTNGGPLLRLLGLVLDSIVKTPGDQRRDSLANLDGAIEKAKTGETKDLESWIGKRL